MPKTRRRNPSNRQHTFAKVQAALGEPPPITPDVALQMLSISLLRCIDAGLSVRAGNDPDLHIQLDGVRVAPNGRLVDCRKILQSTP